MLRGFNVGRSISRSISPPDVTRNRRVFRNSQSLIYLYRALVVPGLLYGSPIWSPYIKECITILEATHHRFIRFLLFRIGKPMSRLEHDFSAVLRSYNLPTIKSLHEYLDSLLVFKILGSYIDCDLLFEIFRIRPTLHSTRNPPAVSEEKSKSKFYFNSVTPRLTFRLPGFEPLNGPLKVAK